jgi:hypothetical protein
MHYFKAPIPEKAFFQLLGNILNVPFKKLVFKDVGI